MDEPAARCAQLLADILATLMTDLPVVCTESTKAEVERHGLTAVEFEQAPHRAAAAALLGDDEISRDGDRAEELVSRAADVVAPGGLVVLTALADTTRADAELRGAFGAAAVGRRPRGLAPQQSPVPRQETRLFTPGQLEHLLLHRGLGVRRLERAGDRLFVAAQAPVSERERSGRFIASLPFKLVTAVAICRDPAGRLLCVYDLFRRHWTVPGGVVDASEDPRSGALREAFEEAGVRVTAGPLLGVFSAAIPDRLLFAYAATPVDPDDPAVQRPVTRQPHEVGDVAWLPLGEALQTLNPATSWRVERCLEAPGETWVE